MKFSRVIWDFNGTIINDVPLSFASINSILEARGLARLADSDAYRNAFCFPIKKFYAALGMDFASEPYEIPAVEWVSLYNAGIKEIPLSEGVPETLEYIRSLGIPQMILSASEKTMLMRQLSMYGIEDYFDDITGTDDIYGGGKLELARSRINSGIAYGDAVLIGDTDHDYTVARELGAACVLYSGGHMSKSALEAFGVPVIEKITDLIKIL